jgi:carboxypeptidase PM20D1
MMMYVAPAASFSYKVLLGNLWMFNGLVSNFMSEDPYFDSIQRTSTATTIFNAGFKDNVIPSEAKATINHRIHPTDDQSMVLRYDAESIEDQRVQIRVTKFNPPSPVSPFDNGDASFQIITNSALEIYPGSVVAPALMTGGTDTKFFQNFTRNIYRFTPAFQTMDELNLSHGLNEKFSVGNYKQTIQFYYRLIKNAAYDIKA